MYSEEALAAKAKVVLRYLEEGVVDAQKLVFILAQHFRMSHTEVIDRIKEMDK